MFHCHGERSYCLRYTLRYLADESAIAVEWHLQQGLAAVLISAPDLMQKYVGAPTFLQEQCAALGFATSGNAAGWNSTTVSGMGSDWLSIWTSD